MRLLFLYITIFISFWSAAQKTSSFVSVGVDYREYPVDVENVPRGGYSGGKGLPFDDSKFWRVMSIHSRYGLRFDKNWLFSLSLYSRHNQLHRLEGINFVNPYPQKVKEKKVFKYDVFLDIEKKVKLRKNREHYFLASAGVGFTNINSQFDVTLTDTADFGPLPSQHYQGTLLHFGPRISIGYQYEKIKASLDAYIIEGPDLTNLTSLWIGATISYEITLRKKK